MMRFVKKHWFLLALAILLLAGLGGARTLAPVRQWLPSDYVVAGVLFLMALTLDTRALRHSLARPGGVMLAVAVNTLAAPLVAWPVSLALSRLMSDFGQGLIVAASVPSTLASAAVWTRRAGGNETVPLLATLITNSACFLTTPLWILAITGRNATLKEGPLEMMLKLALTCVLPIVLGQMVRWIGPAARWADRHRLLLSNVAQLGILSFVLVGAVSAGLKLGDLNSTRQLSVLAVVLMLAAVAGVHLVLLGAGHLCGWKLGLSREDRIGAAFSGSQKTLMVGLYLAQNVFGGLAMLPMIAYHVLQLLLDTVVADRLKAAGSKSAE